jgi:hypothetical protein
MWNVLALREAHWDQKRREECRRSRNPGMSSHAHAPREDEDDDHFSATIEIVRLSRIGFPLHSNECNSVRTELSNGTVSVPRLRTRHRETGHVCSQRLLSGVVVARAPRGRVAARSRPARVKPLPA